MFLLCRTLLFFAFFICTLQGSINGYVASSDGTISVLNTVTQQVSTSIQIGNNLSDVALTPNGSFLYVTNSLNSVWVLNTITNQIVVTIGVGSSPNGVAMMPNGDFAYVVNAGSNNLSVINTGTNQVIATVGVGGNPQNVAITPDGNYAYITNQNGGSVTVINTSTNMLDTTVNVGMSPVDVAITGMYAYVTNSGSNNVSVINTSNFSVSMVGVGNSPKGIAISPNGYAYVANSGDGTVSVINTTTNMVVATVLVKGDPVDVAVTPDGNYVYAIYHSFNQAAVIQTATNQVVNFFMDLGTGPNGITIGVVPNLYYSYVSNQNDGTLSVINNQTYQVVTTINLGAGAKPQGSAINGAGTPLVVTDKNLSAITLINTATSKISATIPIFASPDSVAIQPDGSVAYVTADQFVKVINLTTNQIQATINVGNVANFPQNIAITPNGANLYVALFSPNVAVINTITYQITATIAVGFEPFGVAITPDGRFAYVTNYDGSSISAINTHSNQVIATIPVGFVLPSGIAITPNGQRAYVANNIGIGTLSVIDLNVNQVIATIPGFNNPEGVAITPDGAYVYVTTNGDNGVSVVSTYTNQIVATIPVGAFPAFVSISPLTPYAYIVDSGNMSVSVIDVEAEILIDNLSVCNEPEAIAMNPYLNTAYVTCSGYNLVNTIDTLGNQIFSQAISLSSQPTGIAINDNGINGYVIENSGRMEIFNTSTGLVIDSLNVGNGNALTSIVMNPVQDRAYVTWNNGNQGMVSTIDTKQNIILGAIPSDPNPFASAVSFDGNTLYVLNQNGGNANPGTVTVYNTTSPVSKLCSLLVGIAPTTIAALPYSNTVYVANTYTNSPTGNASINVISGCNYITTIPLAAGVTPTSIAFSPSGTMAYVADSSSDNVLIIDTTKNEVLPGNIMAGFGVKVLSMCRHPHLFIVNYNQNSVTILNLSNGSLVTIPVGINPIAIGFNGITNNIVTSSSSTNLPNASALNQSGSSNSNRFFMQTDIFNTISWSYPPDFVSNENPVGIYRNGLLLATLPTGATTYQDHNLPPGQIFTYSIFTQGFNLLTQIPLFPTAQISLTSVNP